MKIENMVVGELESNSYILIDGLDNCIIVDLGGDYQMVASYLRARKLNLIAIVLTHGHCDHIADAGRFNVPVYIHELDKDFVDDNTLNCADVLGYEVVKIDDLRTFGEGKLEIGDFEIEVIHTPGHTRGSCSFLIDNILFSGDTIMLEACGRTDLATGNTKELENSIVKLLTRFDDAVYILPGHGDTTTVGHEKKYYPINNK